MVQVVFDKLSRVLPIVPPGRTRPRDTFLNMCIETQGRSIEKHIKVNFKGIVNHRIIPGFYFTT